MTETIAIFGGTGNTGKCVVETALEKGYKVRAIARTPSKVETKNENLTVIEGDFENDEAIQQTIQGADYVICTAGGKPGKDYQKAGFMTEFIEKLWPLLEAESSVEVFLYQAGAFCPPPGGPNPFMMKVMRAIAGPLLGLTPLLKDNEGVMQFIHSHPTDKFQFIVTRPAGLKEGEGGKVKLEASDQPEMGAVMFADLGAFTVEAIKDESLYGKYPLIKIVK